MVPDTIHDVVMARIDRLPDELKQLLQMASVLGREFSLRLLSAVLNGKGRFEGLLRDLNRLEFVYERLVGDGIVYVFRHALTQEAAYGSLLERHRKVHHGTVGSLSNSSIGTAATRWRNCSPSISDAVMRPKRPSITRSRRRKNLNAAAPTAKLSPTLTMRFADLTRCPKQNPTAFAGSMP